MQKISRKRLEYACTAFLATMTRQFFALNPGAEECPVKNLADYPADQRSALMRAVGAALKSTEVESNAAFDAWVSQQSQPGA